MHTSNPDPSHQLTQNKHSRTVLIFVLGFISMLLPVAVDMYLSALPAMAKFFNTNDGHIQITLSSYILGFAIGQVIYGPLSDSIGRRPVINWGILIFAVISFGCAFAQSVEQMIVLRFFHGLIAASAGVVINALIRDMFEKHEFSRVMSMVMLVSNIAPLSAPLIGGWIYVLFNWQAIFIVIGLLGVCGLLLAVFILKETHPIHKRQPFKLKAIQKNFITIGSNPAALCFILTSAGSFAGMFAFISAGPFVYIEIFGVKEANFGYFFGLNVVFMMALNILNTRLVKRMGVIRMFTFGITLQAVMSILLVITYFLELPFMAFVLCVSGFVGCIAIVSSNAMAMLMDRFPHIAGTASSLAGTIRFGIAAIVSFILSQTHAENAWPMVLAMFGCLVFASICALIAVKKSSSNN